MNNTIKLFKAFTRENTSDRALQSISIDSPYLRRVNGVACVDTKSKTELLCGLSIYEGYVFKPDVCPNKKTLIHIAKCKRYYIFFNKRFHSCSKSKIETKINFLLNMPA